MGTIPPLVGGGCLERTEIDLGGPVMQARTLQRVLLFAISTRCGQDSDGNPANAGGVLGTVMGRAKLPGEEMEQIAG
jgi:hypothetical protein